MALSALICDTEQWKNLKFDGMLLDYSRQCATLETMDKLFKLAEVFVWQVLDKIQEFSERVCSGSWVGATGKALKDLISISIGGSFLGPLFVHTALQTDPEAIECARGLQLRFLANVDPVDVARNITGLNPETTLVVAVSKTFTMAETLLNARTLRERISSALVAKHMVAVSTNLMLVEKFGIDPNNAFAFWDWVGGRYSGKFLKGASSIDQHFYSAPLELNVPALLGLLSVWHVSFLGYPARAILPYSQALEKLAPHIQQACVSMESNGKSVSIDGVPLPYETGEMDFGEPGTNGQHSFYQLIHQGVIPCDFIGVVKSQEPVYLKVVSNHDELMSNFLRCEMLLLLKGNFPFTTLCSLLLSVESLFLIFILSFTNLLWQSAFFHHLLPSLNAYNIGQLLAIYERRIAVQGFICAINSFDQWGVELGKKATSCISEKGEPVEGFNFSTTTTLKRYLETRGMRKHHFIEEELFGFSSESASADVPPDPPTLLPHM
ncbi:Glucose-6-phosphate isomerase, cytosolic 1 [Camellia lanceoleosa]|uniref:Glucose-6-phosphate isomerase, cytosolic 1 n=1 Tax=Camellia lanceoleosa TaxID=1840588 RepID=A0ACC0GV27_9ERIC|nr:Glucose-6-phosphate isomerase, cytosolic 1 [Camellia lanceoleosa]